MEVARRHGMVLRATLCEIERGVYYATYFQGKSCPDTKDLPRYQVGKSACDAKRQLEEDARLLGYETVSWDEAIVVPEFPARPEAARRKPMVAVDNHGLGRRTAANAVQSK